MEEGRGPAELGGGGHDEDDEEEGEAGAELEGVVYADADGFVVEGVDGGYGDGDGLVGWGEEGYGLEEGVECVHVHGDDSWCFVEKSVEV